MCTKTNGPWVLLEIVAGIIIILFFFSKNEDIDDLSEQVA